MNGTSGWRMAVNDNDEEYTLDKDLEIGVYSIVNIVEKPFLLS